MEKIRFAVVGAGHIGRRHAEMVARNTEAELVSMCDVRDKSEREITFDVPFYSNIEELLTQGPECDVVCICSPNGVHAEQALYALSLHKHVVIEKPMALTKVDCEKVIFSALDVHKQVFCVMQNRYSPPSIWIKDMIDKKILGDIYMVNINCFWNRDDRYYARSEWKGSLQMDGGTLFTQFSHFVDMMYWLFGDIQNIMSRFKNFTHATNTEFEDSGVVTFEFNSGGIGTINFSTCVQHANYESSMTIIAQNGTVKLGGQYMNEVQFCDIKNYTMPELPQCNPANDYGEYKGSAANHQLIIQNVVDTLLGRTKITTNAMEGLKVIEMIERIYQSSPRHLRPGVKSRHTTN